MSTYETAFQTNTYSTATTSATMKAAPSSPLVLGDLADAAKVYAEAASRFIEARDGLVEAQSRWQTLHDQLAKFREQEGI